MITTIIMSVLITNDKTSACTAHLVILRISERVEYVPNYTDMRSTIANTNEKRHEVDCRDTLGI